MVSAQAQWHNKVNIMKLQNNMVSFVPKKKGARPWRLFGAPRIIVVVLRQLQRDDNHMLNILLTICC